MGRFIMFRAALLSCGFATPGFANRVKEEGGSIISTASDFNTTDSTRRIKDQPTVMDVLSVAVDIHNIPEDISWGTAEYLFNAAEQWAMDSWWKSDPDGWVTKAFAFQALEMVLWSVSTSNLIPWNAKCQNFNARDDLYRLAREAHQKVLAYGSLYKKKGRASDYPQVDQANQYWFDHGVYSTLKCVKKHLTGNLYGKSGKGSARDRLTEVAYSVTQIVEQYQGQGRLRSVGKAFIAAGGTEAIPNAGYCSKNAAWALGTWSLHCKDECNVAVNDDSRWSLSRPKGSRSRAALDFQGRYVVTEFDKNMWAGNYWYMKVLHPKGLQRGERQISTYWRVKCSDDNRAMQITLSEASGEWYAWSGFAATYYADFRDKNNNYAMNAYITKE